MTITFHERPAPEPDYMPPHCAVCGEQLHSDEEECCGSCWAPLCSHCWSYKRGMCLDCPSEPEEHTSDWWRALLEAGCE